MTFIQLNLSYCLSLSLFLCVFSVRRTPISATCLSPMCWSSVRSSYVFPTAVGSATPHLRLWLTRYSVVMVHYAFMYCLLCCPCIAMIIYGRFEAFKVAPDLSFAFRNEVILNSVAVCSHQFILKQTVDNIQYDTERTFNTQPNPTHSTNSIIVSNNK